MNLKEVLMERDELTNDDADWLIDRMRHDIREGADPEEVLFDLGLGLDYLEDLIQQPERRKTVSKETLHIGFGVLSEFIKHANGCDRVYCTISSQSHGNGSLPPSWEIQLIVQSILSEHRVAYCLMRLGSCLEVFEEKREELRQRGLSALAAVKDALQDAGFEVVDAKVSMHKDLEKIAGTFDLIEYDKKTDSFNYKRAS